jgi:cystathionine beta-lyase
MTHRSVAFTSASKGWNIPGLKCGVAVAGSPELGAILEERSDALLPGQPGVPATVAAFERSLPWLDALLARLLGERQPRRGVRAAGGELPGLAGLPGARPR